MRALVVADVHGNLPALEAVLADAGKADAVWCLGDVVGLGPWPRECADLLRERRAIGVLGNHDVGRGEEFTTTALLAESEPWTRAMLASDALSDRPEERIVEGVTLLHDVARGVGPTRLPTEADLAGGAMLVGHFHIPYEPRRGVLTAADRIDLRDGAVIVNPGPVGAPDWLPGHASYGLFEDGVVTIRHLDVNPAECLAECERRNAPPQVLAFWQRACADAARAHGDLPAARELYRAASGPFKGGASPRQAALLLEGLARLGLDEGDPEQAARLIGVALRGQPLHPVAQLRVDATLDRLRMELGSRADEFVRANLMTPEQEVPPWP